MFLELHLWAGWADKLALLAWGKSQVVRHRQPNAGSVWRARLHKSQQAHVRGVPAVKAPVPKELRTKLISMPLLATQQHAKKWGEAVGRGSTSHATQLWDCILKDGPWKLMKLEVKCQSVFLGHLSETNTFKSLPGFYSNSVASFISLKP